MNNKKIDIIGTIQIIENSQYIITLTVKLGRYLYQK